MTVWEKIVRARDVNPEPRCGPRLAEVGAGAPLTLRRSLILIITYVYHPDWRNLQKDVRRFVEVGGRCDMAAGGGPAGGGPAGAVASCWRWSCWRCRWPAGGPAGVMIGGAAAGGSTSGGVWQVAC
jgi:hypothetical protein